VDDEMNDAERLESMIEGVESSLEEFEDYFPETAKGEYSVRRRDLYTGVNVRWDGYEGRMIRVTPDEAVQMDQNIFDPYKLAAVVYAVEHHPEKLTFIAPYGSVTKIGLEDIRESIQYGDEDPLTTGDEVLDEYLADPEEALALYDGDERLELQNELEEGLRDVVALEEGNIGDIRVQIRDGNHRAFGALIGGEPYIWVIVSDNQMQDIEEGLYPEIRELLR
jgi:hypothetical protein